jgi:hypothetical protein
MATAEFEFNLDCNNASLQMSQISIKRIFNRTILPRLDDLKEKADGSKSISSIHEFIQSSLTREILQGKKNSMQFRFMNQIE